MRKKHITLTEKALKAQASVMEQMEYLDGVLCRKLAAAERESAYEILDKMLQGTSSGPQL